MDQWLEAAAGWDVTKLRLWGCGREVRLGTGRCSSFDTPYSSEHASISLSLSSTSSPSSSSSSFSCLFLSLSLSLRIIWDFCWDLESSCGCQVQIAGD